MQGDRPLIDAGLLARIASHDAAMRVAVADVSEIGSGATLVTDGRAPDLPDYNHAALLRDDSDALLQRLVAFFEKRGRRPAFVLDPGVPAGARPTLEQMGFTRTAAFDLMLWDPTARHIYTEPEVYMTLATNATLDEYLRIATIDMPEPQGAQARVMLTQEFRTPGFTFLFGLYSGIPAGACPCFLHEGVAQVGPVTVDPEHRGKGVGLALFNYATRQSRKDGAEITYAWNEHGGPAMGICITSGYQCVAEAARQLWTRDLSTKEA